MRKTARSYRRPSGLSGSGGSLSRGIIKENPAQNYYTTNLKGFIFWSCTAAAGFGLVPSEWLPLFAHCVGFGFYVLIVTRQTRWLAAVVFGVVSFLLMTYIIIPANVLEMYALHIRLVSHGAGFGSMFLVFIFACFMGRYAVRETKARHHLDQVVVQLKDAWQAIDRTTIERWLTLDRSVLERLLNPDALADLLNFDEIYRRRLGSEPSSDQHGHGVSMLMDPASLEKHQEFVPSQSPILSPPSAHFGDNSSVLEPRPAAQLSCMASELATWKAQALALGSELEHSQQLLAEALHKLDLETKFRTEVSIALQAKEAELASEKERLQKLQEAWKSTEDHLKTKLRVLEAAEPKESDYKHTEPPRSPRKTHLDTLFSVPAPPEVPVSSAVKGQPHGPAEAGDHSSEGLKNSEVAKLRFERLWKMESTARQKAEQELRCAKAETTRIKKKGAEVESRLSSQLATATDEISSLRLTVGGLSKTLEKTRADAEEIRSRQASPDTVQLLRSQVLEQEVLIQRMSTAERQWQIERSVMQRRVDELLGTDVVKLSATELDRVESDLLRGVRAIKAAKEEKKREEFACRLLRERDMCRLCCDREIRTVFLRCGHACTCWECATDLRACPICRMPIESVNNFFCP